MLSVGKELYWSYPRRIWVLIISFWCLVICWCFLWTTIGCGYTDSYTGWSNMEMMMISVAGVKYQTTERCIGSGTKSAHSLYVQWGYENPALLQIQTSVCLVIWLAPVMPDDMITLLCIHGMAWKLPTNSLELFCPDDSSWGLNFIAAGCLIGQSMASAFFCTKKVVNGSRKGL